MSEFQFAESLSADPVERALAARVTAILNNPRMDSARREWLIRRVQRELIEHRQRLTTISASVAGSKRPVKRAPVVDPVIARRRELGRTLASTVTSRSSTPDRR